MSPNRRIFLNIIATYGRSVYALILGLFTARWVLQSLGQVDFGLYGLVGGLTVFISFFNLLFSSATSRFYAYSVGQALKATIDGCEESGIEECRKWFSTAVFLHTIIPCVFIIIGYPFGVYAIEHWLTIPVDRLESCIWVFRFVCISSFFGMINVPFQAMYTAKQYIAELTIYSFAQTTATFGFVWFMVSHPGNWLTKYALGMCVIVVIPQLLICFRAITIFPECRFNMSYACSMMRVKQLGAFAFWQAFGGFGVIARGQGIQILINKYFGPAFNASMLIANQVSAQSQTLASSLQGAFSPAITTACGAKDYDKMRMLAFRTCKFGMLLGLLFMLPLAVELEYVLKLWLKNPPPATKEICWFILASAIMEKSSSGHMIAVSATGKISSYLTFSGISLMLALPLAWMLFEIGWGASSVGVVMFCTMTLCASGRVWFAKRIVSMKIESWVLKIFLPGLFLVFVSWIFSYCINCFLPPGVFRIVLTAIIIDVMVLLISWFCMFTKDERQCFLSKFYRIIRR